MWNLLDKFKQNTKTLKACYFMLPLLLSGSSSQINIECHQGLTIYWNKQENYHKYLLDIFISQIQQVAHANMPKLMSSVITTMCLTLFMIQTFFMAEKSHGCLQLDCINHDPSVQDFDKRWLPSEVARPVVYWIARPCRFSSSRSLWHPYSHCRGIYVLIRPNHETLSTTLSLLKPFELIGKDTVSLIEYRHLWETINLPFDLRGIC